MAWNEPGNDKDPWGDKKGNDGPPDLDEVVKDLQNKIGGIFGGGKKGKGGSGGGGISGTGLTMMILILAALWGVSGFYIVQPAERGVVLHFGAYQNVTQPGLNWHIPYPIETVYKINVDEVRSLRHKAQMLTRDENIVDVELTVQSRIQDATDYLFQDSEPEKTIQDATETAVRQVIGKNDLDQIMTEGRGAISVKIQEKIQMLLQQYNTGLEVTSVNMQPAKPPEQVKEAFDDAIKAREDKERKENEAKAYANEIVPKARGAAARRLADAKAYKEQRIAEARGEAERFTAVLTEYEKAPDVTRERLYLETIESVMGGTGKVIIDVENGNNLTYLPLDKIMNSGNSQNAGAGTASVPTNSTSTQPISIKRPMRDVSRGRRVR